MGPSVDYLVVPEAGHSSTKVQDALRRGTPVFPEREFCAELLPTSYELISGVRAPFGASR